MNKSGYIAILLLLLLSCNKEKTVEKHLPGTWNIVYYKFTDNEGFNYYPEFEGKFYFEKHASAPAYAIGLTLNHPKITQTRVETGTYNIKSAVKFDLLASNGNGTVTTHPDYEILFISKSDLKILFVDSLNRVHTLALKK